MPIDQLLRGKAKFKRSLTLRRIKEKRDSLQTEESIFNIDSERTQRGKTFKDFGLIKSARDTTIYDLIEDSVESKDNSIAGFEYRGDDEEPNVSEFNSSRQMLIKPLVEDLTDEIELSEMS